MFDLILKGGIVLDGTGGERFRADVGVTRGTITAVGDLAGRRAERVEDVTGMFVLPGFVDALNHADGYLSLFRRPGCESLVRQGITTIVGGNCGTSLAPLGSKKTSRVLKRWASIFGDDIDTTPSSAYEHFNGVRKWAETDGVNLDWLTMKDFMLRLKKERFGVDVATFVGFGTLRRAVVGDEARPSTPEERSLLIDQLREALREGATGLSVGLNFAHEVSEELETLVALATVVHEEGKALSVHLRDEREHISASVDEALAIARASGVSMLLSHLKPIGTAATEAYGDVLKKIQQAHDDGLDVNITVYPYAASYSVLAQFLPSWAYEGSREAMLQRLKDPEMGPKAIAELDAFSGWLSKLIVGRTTKMQETVVGRSIGEIAADRGHSVGESVVRLLLASNGFVLCFDPTISKDAVRATLSHPLSLVVSEGAAYTEEDASELGHLVHPRSFGAYPRFLGDLVHREGLLSWEEAVQKCSSLPALKLGFRDRGFVSRGLRGDLVVVDPERLHDNATLSHPYQYPDGVRHVFVNGEARVLEGAFVDPAFA